MAFWRGMWYNNPAAFLRRCSCGGKWKREESTVTNNRKAAGLDKFFGITAAGSTMRTEIMAGITTFFAMVYILMVNAGMFTATGVSYGAIYIATAISAVVGTVCIGLLANLPLAQASG